MKKPKFLRIKALAALTFFLPAMVLGACAPLQASTPSHPAGETFTPSPPPGPTLSPTRDPNKSKYFDNVESLEIATIPLKPGDEAYQVRSAVIRDMDADGSADVILTLATWPVNISQPIVVLNGEGPVQNIAGRIFPGGIPSIVHSNQIFFTDIDNDGREDLLISEAGIDRPPWVNPDALIGIAMNRGGGIFEDVSATVPEAAKGLRNYPLAAGDLYNDGVVRIVLPSQSVTGEAPNYSGPEKSGLLFWNGFEFVFQQNWIDMSFWWEPENLYSSSFMAVRDVDGDGWQDLYISGSWMTPNHRILYGSDAFPSEELLFTLPEAPYGHTRYEAFKQSDVDFGRGADVNGVVLEDFDGDGDLDIVSIMDTATVYKPGVFEDKNHWDYTNISENGGGIHENAWFQVLRNEGERKFVDVIAQGRDLGYRFYVALLPMDIDLDGDTDLIGQYVSREYIDACVPRWGSTIFINQGDLVFHTIEAEEMFPELSSEGVQAPWASDCATLALGILFPTVITPEGMVGLFVYPVDFDPGHPKLRVLRFHATGQFHLPE